LRPRTVSTIIAVVTGILISLATFGIVFAIWSDFREALLRYGDVKASLAEAQQDMADMQSEVEQARDEVAQARQEREAAQAEADKLNQEMSDMRGQTIELAIAIDNQQQELDAKEEQLSRLSNEVKSLQVRKEELDREIQGDNIQIESLRALKEALGNDIQELEAQIATYQEGELVLGRGDYLAYQVVHAGEEDEVGVVLQGALNRVNVKLSKDGLAIDRESETAAEEFLNGYSLEGEAVIVISAARNVFEGTDVLLGFDAIPLTPLVKQGDVLMDVNVGSSIATVRTMGVGRREITVPAQFDATSLTDLTVILQREMVAASIELGFLPDLRTGEYSTPVEKLVQVADDIIARERPFLIQFVAKEPLGALDGLADAEIFISNP